MISAGTEIDSLTCLILEVEFNNVPQANISAFTTNSVVVMGLDFQFLGREYKTTGWLQGGLSLSYFRD